MIRIVTAHGVKTQEVNAIPLKHDTPPQADVVVDRKYIIESLVEKGVEFRKNAKTQELVDLLAEQ